ncbi:hypothetical protein LUZ60_015192 [Juncus effusus]|nr:hypothetical protein LUZ60_015192 [Juncus effusus]
MASASSSGSDLSDRQNWERVYEKLDEMIRSEQSKSQALLEQREYLLQVINLQELQWKSRLSYLETRIDQMETKEAKWKQYYASKNNVLINAKDDEVSLYRKYAELTEKDLEDYNTCILSLCSEISDLRKKLETTQTLKSQTSSQKDPKAELQKLKQAYKTLKLDYETLKKNKDDHIACLVSEKDFTWNQFKLIENDYNALQKSRNLELDQANEAVEKLRKVLEQSRRNSYEKDEAIERLNGEVQSLKQLNEEKDEMILRLNNEMAASKTVRSGTGRNLRSRNNKRKLGDQEGSGMSADVARASKTVRKTGTKRKLEEASSYGKDADVAGTSKTAPRTLRSRTKRTLEPCNSGMRACASNSQGSTGRIYLSNMKFPKVNNINLSQH